MLVYLAGPYRAMSHEEIDKNIQAAREAGIVLWEKGYTPIVPHLNTAHFEVDCGVENSVYLEGDIEILARCDALVALPNWQKSVGTQAEIRFAITNNIPVTYYPDLPEISTTELCRPKQSAAFLSTVMQMYRIHLQKNADYSPANIMGTGEIGLVTRLWDKMARLLSLTGFVVEISEAEYVKPKTPKNESIDDTLCDMAVYAIIGQLLRKGVWGK